MAKAKQKRAPRITDQKREDMFTAWQEKPSTEYVRTKCGVQWVTAARYREIDNWDDRLAKIKEKANKKADTDAADRRARHIMGAKFFQGKALELVRETGIDTVQNAISAYQMGVKIEREAAGEPGEITQQKIVIELVDGDADPTRDSPPSS